MEDLKAKSSPTQKEPVDLLVGGEGRENSRKACLGCLEQNFK